MSDEPEQSSAAVSAEGTTPAPGPPAANHQPTPRRSRRRARSKPLPVHHIGIAVQTIEQALRFYGETLGLDVVDRVELPDRALKVAFVQAGNTLIELLEPTNPESTVARFLDRRGPGLHHICFGTTDIEAHLRDLKERGIGLIDEVARPGAHGTVAFLQPDSAHGVLVELIQETGAPQETA